MMKYAGEVISSSSNEHSGYGAGSGTIDTTTYKCICGEGTVVYQKDNIPGFRDKDISINCDKCRKDFLAGLDK